MLTMKRTTILALASVLFCGCGITGNLGRNYGKIYPLGDRMDCGSFVVDSFNEYLRSSPKLYGENSYIGYEDFGAGMPRGSVFVILEDNNSDYSSVPSLLRSAAPKKQEFWNEAITTKGYEGVEDFFAIVPEKANTFGGSKIIERPEILIRGRLLRFKDRKYLLLVQDSSPFVGERARERLFDLMEMFSEKIEWKNS